MKRVPSIIMILILVLIPACADKNVQPSTTDQPVQPVAEQSPATASPVHPLALDSSVPLVPQIISDLASRLSIPENRISLQGTRPVVWQTEALRCPPPFDPTFPLEYVMIVTKDDIRYELPLERPKADKNAAMVIILLAGEATYSYYVVDDHVLFCSDEQ